MSSILNDNSRVVGFALIFLGILIMTNVVPVSGFQTLSVGQFWRDDIEVYFVDNSDNFNMQHIGHPEYGQIVQKDCDSCYMQRIFEEPTEITLISCYRDLKDCRGQTSPVGWYVDGRLIEVTDSFTYTFDRDVVLDISEGNNPPFECLIDDWESKGGRIVGNKCIFPDCPTGTTVISESDPTCIPIECQEGTVLVGNTCTLLEVDCNTDAEECPFFDSSLTWGLVVSGSGALFSFIGSRGKWDF